MKLACNLCTLVSVLAGPCPAAAGLASFGAPQGDSRPAIVAPLGTAARSPRSETRGEQPRPERKADLQPARGTQVAEPVSAAKVVFTPVVRQQEGVYGKSVTAAGKDLLLHGVGLCEWGIFGIDLYYCALYAERRMETPAQAIAADQVLVIHLDFVRKLTATQLGDAFTAATKVNVGDALPSYQKPLAALCAAMRDVAAGDSYTFVLVPQKGIEVRRNGELVTVVGDEPFRVLFQRLYLGDKPPTEDLRKGMLGWKS